MVSQYYDNWEFRKAQDIRTEDPFEAVKKLEKYITEYPRDYLSYGYYASNLITIGKIKEAQNIIDYVERQISENKKYLEQQEKQVERITQSILFNRLRIASYTENYRLLYHLCSKQHRMIKDMDVNSVDFYCKSKLGMLDSEKREKNGYVFRQMVEYSESDFFDHIHKHMPDYNSALDERNKNIFAVDFPLKEILTEAKKHMIDGNYLFTGLYEDTYTFKYDECGRVDNRMVNYFQIICFHKTSNIITVLPVSGVEKLPYIDLNYMKKEEQTKKIKRESAVEKFNKRFKR